MKSKPSKLSILALSILFLGLGYVGAQQGSNPQSRINENGAEVILDGSLHTTGASRTDKFFENVGVSTPSTPSLKHSRTWLNSTTHQLCTIFDDGSTSCN